MLLLLVLLMMMWVLLRLCLLHGKPAEAGEIGMNHAIDMGHPRVFRHWPCVSMDSHRSMVPAVSLTVSGCGGWC